MGVRSLRLSATAKKPAWCRLFFFFPIRLHLTARDLRLTSLPEHETPPPGLRDWLERAKGASLPAVEEVRIDGVQCVVKHRRPGVRRGVSYGLRYIRAALLAVGCKVVLGEFPRPGVLLRNGLDYEAERLRRLRAAGCRVPDIWWHEPGLLVLEHVGTDLNALIRHGDDEYRTELARRAARDLAEFHLLGFCHGGAQIRNLTVRDNEIWRIDFEENIGEALSPPLSQAYDLFQMVASLLSMRNLPARVMPPLGKVMLASYFEVNPDPEVRARLLRLGRFLRVVAWPLRPLLGWLRSRDIQGFFRVADSLRP
jgi:tRNA A-37 threonylcarbamoyl transferase component Bud32